jgi:molybdopterin-containing oxidoreductase family iron-sulfur binding subunit
MSHDTPDKDRPHDHDVDRNTSRRTVVKGVGATLGAAAFLTALSPLRHLAKELTAEEFMQQLYKELVASE